MNNRRKLVIALGAATLVPFGLFAQQPGKVWRVGYISSYSRQTKLESGRIDAFLQEMRKLGYVEGKNLVIEWRFADQKYERLADFAAELAGLKPDVIVATASPAIRAAQKATATIPIVMTGTGDPVGSGFAASLARPGGNITGLSLGSDDVSAKQLELLLSVTPKLSHVAALGHSSSSTHASLMKKVRTAAQSVGVAVMEVGVRTPEELASSFTDIARAGVKGVIVLPDGFTAEYAQQIAELASKFRLSTIAGVPLFADAGGLMSYTRSANWNFVKAATYVDKILKGAKPADLPIEQPTTLELVINLKTAKAIGIKFPQSILALADMVIE